jgi:hypothetical protein
LSGRVTAAGTSDRPDERAEEPRNRTDCRMSDDHPTSQRYCRLNDSDVDGFASIVARHMAIESIKCTKL